MRSRLTALVACAAVVGAMTAAVTNANPATASPPVSATDATKAPHYFGPWPNWALSPLTTKTAVVTITDSAGTGTGATATADVDLATGAVTGITLTNPGHDYTSPVVTVTGQSSTGTPALATAVVTGGNTVVGYTVTAPGTTYGAFAVSVTGGGGTGATARASGRVSAIDLASGGSGYTMPTVDFDLPDLPGGVRATGHVPMIAQGDAVDGMTADGTITTVVLDNPGSGYLTPPGVAILNGTAFDPVPLAAPAEVTATMELDAVTPLAVGSGYTTAPAVAVTDPTGTGAGATATATLDRGAITAVQLSNNGGSGYVTYGIKKFKDDLPGLCDPAAGACPASNDTKAIPLAVPAEKTYSGEKADEYVIGVVQYRTKFASDLPATLVRGYVQLETPDNASWSQHYELKNEFVDPQRAAEPVMLGGKPVLAVTAPQWLGPIIGATKNRPVRIVFRNLLPTGADGDLFLPTDSTMMGSGMGPEIMDPVADDGKVTDLVRNPLCTQEPKDPMCFKDNRATLHLHGGTTPWISDGTPHQWITPAGEDTAWPQGVAVSNVPDMVDTTDNSVLCDKADDGCQTFYYTNQQSARLMFYHDHAWGITRLNVYAGEAAGYLITDDIEKKLVTDKVIPGADATIPLVVQDRTFVPSAKQLYDMAADGTVMQTGADHLDATTGKPIPIASYGQDPTWDAARWGSMGSFWYHHVYMPAQNPGDPSGMSAYGRWMYGPWFWPPATSPHGPIANPYYDPACKIADPTTWTYQTDPFCEPELIPGTPNVSAGMEQFNDTPIVNGVAYPKVTLKPQAYRFRMLNAANDRFFNFQWYVADAAQGNTEVALKPAEVAAAQTDPNVFPTPVAANDDTAGPDWVQIASEGGFLPAPAVIDGQQPTTWITDPTRFDVGNVDQHSMLLAPAERSDVIVDFSAFAGKTLILYNDAPAAFPARVASYDYYTGAPDLSPNGAPGILPGYGPNTRTVMQVTIEATTPAAPFDVAKLTTAFKHKANGSGVFENGQHPIIVGQAAYNDAYGTGFDPAKNCNGGSTSTTCDGQVRINDTGSFTFNTLRGPTTRTTINLEPKAIHDEMNSSTFDEFGRMQANLGIEAQPPTPGLQNVTLFPYVNPTTEVIDGTKLQAANIKITAMSTAGDDGTQIWRITHNGVDTHPIHFHLFDVQVLNRVTWDNIIIPPDPNELGWKDTVRVSPLEDTIVALRPVVPQTPFEVPNSVRPLNPMMPLKDTSTFNNMDVQGNPTTAIQNALVNFGWEYVYHCHILSHEEMDMMRPVDLALPPAKASGLWTDVVQDGTGTDRWQLHWDDNSLTETSFVVESSPDGLAGWTAVGTVDSPLATPNVHQTRALVDPASTPATGAVFYRVVAKNRVGLDTAWAVATAQSVSAAYPAAVTVAPAAPVSLTGTIVAGPAVALTWQPGAGGPAPTGYRVQRTLTGSAAWATIGETAVTATSPALTFTDTKVSQGASYDYRVVALNNGQPSAPSATFTIALVAPSAPTGLTGVLQTGPAVALSWTNPANATGLVVERSTDAGATWTTAATLTAPLPTTWTDTAPVVDAVNSYRVHATNLVGPGPSSNVVDVPVMSPAAPTGLAATLRLGATSNTPEIALSWTDNATGETGYAVQRSTDGGTTWTPFPLPADSTAFVDTAADLGGLTVGTTYTYRVDVTNLVATRSSATVSVTPALPAAPTGLTARLVPATATSDASVVLAWTDNATNETGTVVERSTNGGTSWTTLTTLAGTPGTGTAGSVDLAPVPGATDLYRVRATGIMGTSAGAQASVTLVPLPAAVNGYVTTIRSGPSVRIAWTDRSTNESGFSVQRSTNGGQTWTQISTRPAQAGTGTALTRTDSTVTRNATYSYRVVVWNASGRVPTATNTLRIAAPPMPATVTTPARATATGTTESIPLSWSSVPEATDYRVQRATSNTGANTTTVTVTGTSYTFTGLAKRVWYVRVGARNGLGTTYSPWVAVAAAP